MFDMQTDKLNFNHIPRKSVCIPASPPVDIAALIPLVDHPFLQRLRHRKQLGINSLVFPGAVHTRFEHAMGVLGLTQRLGQIHSLKPELQMYLAATALLHDIGHGPFSHQIEPIIGGSHKSVGIELVHEMEPELRQCGLELQQLIAFLTNRNPLGQLVNDRNLGTDKLDYLRRDALHIGFSGMPNVEKVQYYTLMEDNIPAIEEKFIEDIKRVQKFYSYLHQHGYLNKTALSIQRIFQRAVQEELSEGHMDADRIWRMTDMELLHWLNNGLNPLAKSLMSRLQNRSFHRTLLVIKPAGYGFVERHSPEKSLVIEWSRERIRNFTEYCSDIGNVQRLEQSLCRELKLCDGDLLFAAMPFFEKLIPRDVRIFSSGAGGSFWLFEKDRDHFQSVQGDYLRTFAIRVITPPDLRPELRQRAETILTFLEAKFAEQ